MSVRRLALTSSKVMMHVHCWKAAQSEDFRAGRIFVWDWKTGDLVMSLGLE